MIAFLDTSAVVPLLISEPTSSSCQRLWNDADQVVAVRLAYVEVASALARANRLRRLNERDLTSSLAAFEDLWSQLELVEADDRLIRRAAYIAKLLGLRGYDAVHCAAAEQLEDATLVAASGDRELLRAWAQLGVATYDTHGGTER